MAAITSVPNMVGGLLEDVRTIARGMQVLPELAKTLSTIEARVLRIEGEVARMRQAVESMGGDVGSLPDRLDELQDAIPLRRRRRS